MKNKALWFCVAAVAVAVTWLIGWVWGFTRSIDEREMQQVEVDLHMWESFRQTMGIYRNETPDMPDAIYHHGVKFVPEHRLLLRKAEAELADFKESANDAYSNEAVVEDEWTKITAFNQDEPVPQPLWSIRTDVEPGEMCGALYSSEGLDLWFQDRNGNEHRIRLGTFDADEFLRAWTGQDVAEERGLYVAPEFVLVPNRRTDTSCFVLHFDKEGNEMLCPGYPDSPRKTETFDGNITIEGSDLDVPVPSQPGAEATP